jgi:hypothetical protein
VPHLRSVVEDIILTIAIVFSIPLAIMVLAVPIAAVAKLTEWLVLLK